MKKSYRYRTRRVYPKQKWAINAVQYNFATPAPAASNFTIQSSPLIENPARNTVSGSSVSTASSILKCAHIKIKGVLPLGMIQGQNALITLMYCPEGVNPNLASTSLDNIGSTIFYSHPEWIMAWTRMDYASFSQKNEFSLTTRLKRNLNPGDTIRLIVYNINTSTENNASNINLSATASYCCRNN